MANTRKKREVTKGQTVLHRLYMSLDLDKRKAFCDEAEISKRTMQNYKYTGETLRKPFLMFAQKFLQDENGLIISLEDLKKPVNTTEYHGIIRSAKAVSA